MEFAGKYLRGSTWVPIFSETKTDRDIPFFVCYGGYPKESECDIQSKYFDLSCCCLRFSKDKT